MGIDGNGKVDLPEFIQLMEKMNNPTEENASTLEAFRAFDSHDRGFVPARFIREVLTQTLEQVPSHEVIDLLSLLELTDDRIVTYEEFSKMVTPKAILDMDGKVLNLAATRQHTSSFESNDDT